MPEQISNNKEGNLILNFISKKEYRYMTTIIYLCGDIGKTTI
jgi:hypothetical protein